MNIKAMKNPAMTAVVGLAAIVGSIVVANPPKEAKSTTQPEMKLPPGWTEADMQACMIAGTPGKMHERLAKDVGSWHGTTTMWMVPDAEPLTSACSATIRPIMDGRYFRHEMVGEMPGMGSYSCFGINGFDNVLQEFVSIWIDNRSTGIMKGVGKLSPDGKTITWQYTHNCPLTRKPTVMREVETVTGPNTKTLEMFGTDVKTRKEFKMMHIELTRK